MANGQETVVVIPVVVPPIEVEVTLGVVPVEVRHVAVAVDLRDGTLCRSAIHATAHRVPSQVQTYIRFASPGCIVFATLYVAERSAPTVFFFDEPRGTLRTAVTIWTLACAGCGQITRSRDLGFFTCQIEYI